MIGIKATIMPEMGKMGYFGGKNYLITLLLNLFLKFSGIVHGDRHGKVAILYF